MKNADQYHNLLGKTKQEVIKEIGNEFNYYCFNTWSYHLKTTWFGQKVILLVHFKDDQVTGIRIKKHFGKIRY